MWFLLVALSFFSSLFSVERLDSRDPRWAWMDEQLEQEFLPFKKSGITTAMLDETMRRAPGIGFGNHLLRFQIVNGKVYGPSEPYPGAKDLLEKVVSLYPVPNVDVILFTQDILWHPWLLAGPIFATCKRGDAPFVLHLPIQLSIEWEKEFVPLIEKACQHSPWEGKIPQIFWRGFCNDADNYNDPTQWTKLPRGKLCYLSQQHPHLVNAAFSGFHAHQISTDLREIFCRFFPLSQASWEEYLNHKYLIDLDGYVASTPGCAWKLLSNCACFKHDSPFTLWFYKILKPGVHYIPIKHDLSDLLEKLQWAKEHDPETRQIAENGRILALENLMPEHVYLYCYKALCKYASLLRP